jgi:hypothetical protein
MYGIDPINIGRIEMAFKLIWYHCSFYVEPNESAFADSLCTELICKNSV